jgi:hypothetical protein
VSGHNFVLCSQRLGGGYQCDPTLNTEFCGGWVVATTVGTTTLQRSATLVTEICAGSSITMAGLAAHLRLPRKNTNVRTVVIVPRIRSIHFKQFLLSPGHSRPSECGQETVGMAAGIGRHVTAPMACVLLQSPARL